MHSETKTKFHKTQIAPNTVFRDDEHQAEVGILGITVNASADIEVDDEATKRICGGHRASWETICKLSDDLILLGEKFL